MSARWLQPLHHQLDRAPPRAPGDRRPLPVGRGRARGGRPLPPELAERAEFTFLGRGWAAPVADEAALKLREAARTWAESYPAMEYRHGPISVSDENTVARALGDVPPGLLADARRTGATVIASDADPLVALDRSAAARRRTRRVEGHRPGPAPGPWRVLSSSLDAPAPLRCAVRRPGRGHAGRRAQPRLDPAGRGPYPRCRPGCAARADRARRHRPARRLGAAGVARYACARGRRHLVYRGNGRGGQGAAIHRRNGSTTIVASLVTAPLGGLQARAALLAGPLAGKDVMPGSPPGRTVRPRPGAAPGSAAHDRPDVAAFERLHAAAAGRCASSPSPPNSPAQPP